MHFQAHDPFGLLRGALLVVMCSQATPHLSFTCCQSRNTTHLKASVELLIRLAGLLPPPPLAWLAPAAAQRRG